MAIVAPPPADLALGVISAAASALAGEQALKDHQYVEAAVDAATLIPFAGGAVARVGEHIAEVDHAVAAEHIDSLTREIAKVKPVDATTLTAKQQSNLTSLFDALKDSRSRAATFRQKARVADAKASVIALVAAPQDPAVRK